MLKICIIDITASGRSNLYQIINKYLQFSGAESKFMPAFSLDSISANEIKYREKPDVIVLGEALTTNQPEIIKTLLSEWPDIGLISFIESSEQLVSKLDNLARLGVSDVISPDTKAIEFIKKVILLSKKRDRSISGQIVLVDSAKGGEGKTTITAALADTLSADSKKVLIVDLDFRNQSLSRYTQSRPFYNDGLISLLIGHKAITKENTDDLIYECWLGEEIDCLTPCSLGEFQSLRNRNQLKNLGVLTEKIAESYDFIIVDLACQDEELRELFYRLADQIIFIVSNDPAAIYSSCNNLKTIWNYLSYQQKLLLLENRKYIKGLESSYLRKQISDYTELESCLWVDIAINYSKEGFLWAGSGRSFYSLSNRANNRAFHALRSRLSELDKSKKQQKHFLGFLGNIFQHINWNKNTANMPAEIRESLPQITLAEDSVVNSEKEQGLSEFNFLINKSVADSG